MTSVTVEVSDVAARYNGILLDRFTTEYVQSQITDAVDIANSLWGSQIEQRLASGSLTANLYKRIISEAVLRVIRNPEGYTSEADGTYNYSKSGAVASGVLSFGDDDIALLAGIATSTVPKTVTVGIADGWS